MIIDELNLEALDELSKAFLIKTFDENFVNWLETQGYFEAPAGTHHHGAEIGGLLQHSFQVAVELQYLTDTLKLEWNRPESPVIVGLLHDVCKLDDYVWTIQDFPNGEKKIDIRWNKDREEGHGSKSLEILNSRILLTDQEKQCIRYHMGAFTDKSEWHLYSDAVSKDINVLYTHTADMIASQVKHI
jgi:hypothetical protein